MYSMPVGQQRIQWTFQSQRAGYWKQFKTPTGSLHFVTVKLPHASTLRAQTRKFGPKHCPYNADSGTKLSSIAQL
ncbi:unnamed protein product [Gongylonema pulchrum]|uniref:Transposase n=1 Tax=Gongylonema pulchrum TaxID=637853 RepID=A0A183EXN7_9BILA|nr:unnamed protein product [Gongylonema pulchrum]